MSHQPDLPSNPSDPSTPSVRDLLDRYEDHLQDDDVPTAMMKACNELIQEFETQDETDGMDPSYYTQYHCECGWVWREFGDGHAERGAIDCSMCGKSVRA